MKKIKDLEVKLKEAIKFLETYNDEDNYARVTNWLKMLELGYKHKHKQLFKSAFTRINNIEINSVQTKSIGFSNVSKDLRVELLKDLNKRKYSFQFNKAPKAHIDFVNKLQKTVLPL